MAPPPNQWLSLHLLLDNLIAHYGPLIVEDILSPPLHNITPALFNPAYASCLDRIPAPPCSDHDMSIWSNATNILNALPDLNIKNTSVGSSAMSIRNLLNSSPVPAKLNAIPHLDASHTPSTNPTSIEPITQDEPTRTNARVPCITIDPYDDIEDEDNEALGRLVDESGHKRSRRISVMNTKALGLVGKAACASSARQINYETTGDSGRGSSSVLAPRKPPKSTATGKRKSKKLGSKIAPNALKSRNYLATDLGCDPDDVEGISLRRLFVRDICKQDGNPLVKAPRFFEVDVMDHLVNLVMTSALEQKGWEWSYEATRRLIGFICTDDAAWKRSNSDQNNSKVVAGGNESDVNFDNTILGRDDQGFPTCPTNKRNFEDFKADSKDPSIDKNSKKAKEGIFVFKTINLSGEEDWKPLSLENVFQNLVAQSKDGICVKKVPTSNVPNNPTTPEPTGFTPATPNKTPAPSYQKKGSRKDGTNEKPGYVVSYSAPVANMQTFKF